MGEDVSDMATTTSSLQAKLLALTGGQVDIMLDENTFKNSTQILREMAGAWEDMTDIQRASALELMGGKRQANTLSALITNFDTVEKVIEASANSTGSALEENERYLDSIQGKIDQFNNSVQSMWNNALESDTVKGIIEMATWLIKAIEKIGLFKSALIGLASYSMLKNKMGPISFFKGIVEMGTQGISKLSDYINSLKNTTTATITLTQAQLKEKLVKTGLTDAVAEQVVVQTNLGKTTDVLSAKTLDATLREAGYNAEKRESIIQSVFDTEVTRDNTQANIENAASNVVAGQAEDQETRDTIENIGATVTDTTTTDNNTQANLRNATSNATSSGGGIKGFLKNNAMMLGITAAIAIIAGSIALINHITTTVDEAKEEFNDLTTELDSTRSELDNLDAQLEDINDRIEEIKENTPLSFTDKEELARLQEQTAEIERQKDLLNSLKEQQELGVNSAAIDMANVYKDVGVKTGKTTEENVGTGSAIGAGVVGAGGAIGGAIVGAKIGTAGAVGGPVGAAIGIIAGALIGAIVGALGGAGVGAAISANEKKVGESLEDMKEQYAKLQEEFNESRLRYQNDPTKKKNKKDFEEAQEAFNAYKSNMANYLTELNSVYDEIKSNWDTATTEQKAEVQEFEDQMDTWLIQSGDKNAKSNAIGRIFGDYATDELKEVKKQMQEAAEAGEEISLADAFNGDEDAYNAFKIRLENIGLTVSETEKYFKDEKRAADEAIESIETYDALKQIQKLTDGVNGLKNAFKELHEEGIVSAETLLGMEESFKHLEKPWKNFVEIMSSGTATMEEAQNAAKELAEAYIDDIISSPDGYNKDERLTYINHLQSIGVKNAGQFIDAKVKKDMVTDIAQRVKSGASEDDAIKEVEEIYGIALDSEEDIALIQAAITKEKKAQAVIDAKTNRGTYDTMAGAKKDAKDKLDDAKEALKEAQAAADQKATDINPEDYLKDRKGDKQYRYDGRWFKTADELREYIKNNIDAVYQAAIDQAQKEYDAIEVPIEVTDIDVQNAQNEADEAAETLQTELNKRGLTLEIDLIGFDEKVDKVQDVYSTLKNIATEYNTQGHLSLDNLQALLQLTPEYLSVLKMENGQITINQDALQSMLETKLDEAEATAVQTAITQLSALAQRKEAIEISNSAVAANQATIELGTYSSALGTVAQDAITAAGSVTLFNNALEGAQENAFVSDDEINQILANFNNSVELINSVRENLSSDFNNILDPGSQTSSEEVADDRFQKAMDYWENRISANQAKSEQIQNEIDLLESKGQKADKSFYEEIIKLENERKWLLEQQKKEAQSYLSEFQEGSEEWWEIANTLNDIESELDDVTSSIVDLQDAMAEVDAYKLDEFNNRLDNLISKLGTIRDIIAPDGEEDWFDDEGNWTESGVAVLGSYLQELESYKQGYEKTVDELNKYAASYQGNEAYYEALGIHSEQDWYEKTEQLISQQYEFASSISDTEQSIVDMYENNIDAVEEYTQTLVDSYNDYIDNVKEALDAERDLYDFKKNVQKQTKDIAALERRIASLSGSTNASDIAERRRLEADLYDAREELDNTYYDHARDAQTEALDKEAEAYEESMNNFIDGLRTSLDEATANMDEFLMGVTSMVMYNADTVLTKYQETNLPLTTELINPWIKAKEAVGAYSGNAIDLMNQWTKQGGFFSQFNTSGTTNLTSPWSAGTNAANTFKTSVSTTMSSVVSNISTNVKTAASELSKLYQQIQDTEQRAASANVAVASASSSSGSNGYVAPQKKYYVTAFLDLGSRSLSVTKSDSDASKAMSAAKNAILGEYEKVKGNNISAETAWQRTWRNKVKYTTQYYAKGTTSTTRDQWAITDEPWLGNELVLVPGPNGNLQYMRAGTAVMPADISANLVEWGKINPNMLNIGDTGANINMISNAINKPEIKLNVENFLKVDRVDKDTLPQLEALMDKKIDTFAKQLNYSLGKFAK